MNNLEKFIYFLQAEMNAPKAYGWFHLLCLFSTFIVIFLLFKIKKKNDEKQLKLVLGCYGITAFILELLKQLIWSFNYDSITNIIVWDYEWYAFPFQLCTTPIYVSLICLFLKKGKIRNALLSYMAFVTILGSISTMLIPDSCFVSDILINIHTMWLHLGSFVVSIYIIINDVIKINKKIFTNAIYIFIVFVIIALLLNIIIYNSNIINGETFNMFYISPYFTSSLPIFNIIQEKVPYILFLLIYIFAITLGAAIIYFISKNIKKIIKYIKEKLLKNYLNEIIVLLIQLYMFYVFPMFIYLYEPIGTVMIILITTIILSIVLGFVSKNKIKYLYPIIISVLFIPTIYIYYNDSAFVHSLWYLIVSTIGLLFGKIIKLIIKNF